MLMSSNTNSPNEEKCVTILAKHRDKPLGATYKIFDRTVIFEADSKSEFIGLLGDLKTVGHIFHF